MKTKLLLTLIAMMALAVCASAQDPGSPDSIFIAFTHVPDMSSNDSLVEIEVTFWVDENVRSVAAGFGWDFDNFVMDSAAWTTEGNNAFNFFKFLFSQNDVDSTNFYKRFQATGLGSTGITMETTVAHYWGHVTRWEGSDAINITQNSFVASAFVDNSNNEFVPVWREDINVADVTSIGGALVPTKFELAQNYPNPFNPSTKITFDLPQRAHANLVIYNVLGQQVRTLVDEDLEAKSYEVTWNSTNDAGSTVASGIYFYRLTAGEKTKTKKMMLLK